MSTKIKINRLIVDINKEKVNQQYDFFYLETCDKYIRRGAYILDIVSTNSSIKAVKFENGKKMLVMLNAENGNLQLLKSVLSEVEDGEKFSIKQVDAKDIEEWTLVQIFFNALGVYDSELLKFNNLTGHLYCYHEGWLKHGKDRDSDIIWKVPSLEIVVDKNMCLLVNVRTFTSEKLKNKITFKKRKFDDYPKYVFSARKTLRRKLSSDKETCFIMRQIDGTKTEIPFLDIQSVDKFDKTKVGVLQDILRKFEEKYHGLINLSFEIKEVKERVDFSKKFAKENISVIKKLLQSTGVNIVDEIGDNYSSSFCDGISKMLLNKYGVKAGMSRRAKKDKLNLCVIHNKEYYEGINDPHDKVYADVAVQHITFEDFADSSEFAIDTVMHEIIIKKDLQEGVISLFDWTSLGIKENIFFGTEVEIEEVNRYFFMKISPDGSFTIREQELTLFEMNEYSECVEIFENARMNGEVVKGIIKTESGIINVIKDSKLFTLPEMDNIKELLMSGDNKLRGKERREELLSSCLDIKLYKEGVCQYYYVGTIGEGMRVNIQRAAVIRKIEGHNDSPIIFEQLLPLMGVTFVHNGQLTVIPFPFKYLREYVNAL